MSNINAERNTETLNLEVVKMGAFIKMVSVVFAQRMEKYKRKVEERDGIPTMERPILGIGKPGIGKTEIMRSLLINRFGLSKDSVVELRLGSMQDTDIIGMPTVKNMNGYDVTKFAAMEVLPREATHPKYGILILDEITTCDSGVRSVALQLLDSSRSVGDYTLPDGWMIVALGNGPDDGADYEEIKSTIISRCMGFYVDIDFETWYEWASQNGVHGAVLGFLRKGKGQDLFSTEGRGEYDSQIATPRTWQITSDMLKVCEATSPNGIIPEELVRPVCASGIGAKMGEKFRKFYIYKQSLIPLDQIIDGSALRIYKKEDIVLEAMYLGQDTIVQYIKSIGEKHRDFFTRCAQKFTDYNKTPGWDTLPDEDVEQLANITKFIIWYSDVNLDWSLSTLEAITKTSTYSKLKIHMYFCIQHSKLREKCPEFVKFVEKNSSLTNAIRF